MSRVSDDSGERSGGRSATRLTLRMAGLIALGLGLAGAGCGGGGAPGNSAGSRREVTLGLITPLSGEVADLGSEILASANLAIDDANRADATVKFRLVPQDDRSSLVAASSATRGLIQREKAAAVMASGTSAMARAIIEAAKGTDVPVVTPTATSGDLADGSEFVFRVIPTNRDQGEALAEFAVDSLKAKTAAIVFQQEEYSTDLRDAFRARFKARGGRVALELGFEGDETDFRAILEKLKGSGVDTVACMAQHVPMSRFLIRARQNGLEVPILGGETAFTDKLLAAVGGEVRNVYVTGSAVDLKAPGPKLKAFLDAYEKAHGKKPGIYGCYSYDAVGVLTDTLRGVAAPEGLAKALRERPVYEGVTGPIQFSKTGAVRREYRIYTVRDGTFRPVDRGASPATTKTPGE